MGAGLVPAPRRIALLSAAGIGAAVALGALQGRRLARPLEQLARTSTRLGEGDFSTRAERSAIAEIDAVAAALDSTAIRIATLLGRERGFSANAAHQLQTPLTALRLRLEEIEALDGEATNAETAKALHEVDRLQSTITDLLALAEDGRAGDAGRLDVAELRHTANRRGSSNLPPHSNSAAGFAPRLHPVAAVTKLSRNAESPA